MVRLHYVACSVSWPKQHSVISINRIHLFCTFISTHTSFFKPSPRGVRPLILTVPSPFIPPCHTEVDMCVPNPCLNGAACTNLRVTYQCTCTSGWTGTNCSQGNYTYCYRLTPLDFNQTQQWCRLCTSVYSPACVQVCLDWICLDRHTCSYACISCTSEEEVMGSNPIRQCLWYFWA